MYHPATMNPPPGGPPADRRRFGAILGVCGLLVPTTAAAAGADLDFELVRPRFTHGALPGLDAPTVGAPGTWRVGLFSQYERDPLQIYENEGEVSTVVGDRQWSELGVSVDVARPLSLRARVPVVAQWGGAYAALEGDGVGLGDVSIGGILASSGLGTDSLRSAGGLRADLSLPTGTNNSWIGEGLPVFDIGVLGSIGAGQADLLVDLGGRLRQDVEVAAGWTQGSQWTAAIAARAEVAPPWLALHAGLRAQGSAPAGAATGAAVEALGGFQARLGAHIQVDLGAGTGATDAVGTSSRRLFLGLTWLQPGPAPAPPAVVAKKAAPVALPTAPEEWTALPEREAPPEPPPPPPAPAWTKDQLARLRVDRIETASPLEFAVGTNDLAPSALATVAQVAAILNEDGRLMHVVIEGHASSEGDVATNYSLSMQRAMAVYVALVAAGVHPDRLSIRGKGEVKSAAEKAAAERDRRVDFLLVRTRLPGEPNEAAAGAAAIPWSGAAATFVTPPIPAEEKK